MGRTLTVAIEAMPAARDSSLAGDLRLVTPAPRYGDRVTLSSPGAAILALLPRSLARGHDVADPRWLDAMERTSPEAREMVGAPQRLEGSTRRLRQMQIEVHPGHRTPHVAVLRQPGRDVTRRLWPSAPQTHPRADAEVRHVLDPPSMAVLEARPAQPR